MKNEKEHLGADAAAVVNDTPVAAPERQAHTELPWSISDTYDHIVTGPDGLAIFECWFRGRRADARANAALIVRACNNHDGLLQALKEAEHQLAYLVEGGDFLMADDTITQLEASRDDIRAAIAKAEGREP